MSLLQKIKSREEKQILRHALLFEHKKKVFHRIVVYSWGTEFRASFFCHFKKLRCKSLFIVNVTFKSQILKFILCSRQSHVNENRRKR
jgi:hypothetical protein